MTRLSPTLLASSVLLLSATAALADDFPPGPDQPIVEKACTSCHPGTQVTSLRKTPDQWANTVNDMIANGAQVSDDDYTKVVNYLATNFGIGGAPAAAPAPDGSATPAPAPAPAAPGEMEPPAPAP